MKDILLKSNNIIKFWITEVVLDIVFLVLIIFSSFGAGFSGNNNGLVISGILIILLILFVIVLKTVMFIKNILLFLEIKKKCDYMMFEENRAEREDFLNLNALKNNLLIIVIFELIFPIVSMVFKVIYWNKVKEIVLRENIIN